MHIFAFLDHVAQGGPTAARTVWNQLLFLRKRLGIGIPLKDAKEYVLRHVQSNVLQQAKVLEPDYFLGLLLLLHRARGSARVDS